MWIVNVFAAIFIGTLGFHALFNGHYWVAFIDALLVLMNIFFVVINMPKSIQYED